MKKLLPLITLSLSLLFAHQVFADNEIKLNIDNEPVSSDIAPQIIDGRTMVPVRAIFEGVGADVNWNAETKTITGEKQGIEITMSIDSNIVNINGKAVTMDCGPVIVNGRTLAPARYVAESFGCNVEWDSVSKTVNITTPLQTLEYTTSEYTTETTTISTTEVSETTTNPMYNYNTYYKPGTYTIGVDMPEGEYVVFANPEKIGYLYNYAKDGNVGVKTGKRYLYNKYFDYCDVIRVEKNEYLDLSNAYAIPSSDVNKIEEGHNGTYRAGTDIKTGHLTFKLSPETTVGFVDVGLPGALVQDRKIKHLNPENDSVTINVTKGMYIKVFGCDILDERLTTIFTYIPVSENSNNTDSKYDFSKITPSLKTNIESELTTIVNDMNYNTLKGNKYTKNQLNKTTDNWNSLAKSGVDKKYVYLAKQLYSYISDYAVNTNGDVASEPAINLNKEYISGQEYKTIIDYEIKYIKKALSDFKSASTFKDMEIANTRLSHFKYNVPRLKGTTEPVMRIFS